MPNPTNSTAGSDVSPETPEPLTTASGEWAVIAAQIPDNEDVHVATVDPLFHDQTKLAVVSKMEVAAADETGKGFAVRPIFELKEEIEDTLKNKKAPGWKYRVGFPWILVPTPDLDKGATKADMGRRNLASLAVAAGLFKKGATPSLKAELIPAIDKLVGKEVKIAFSTKKSATRGEDGEFRMNQNVRFLSPTAAAKENGPVRREENY